MTLPASGTLSISDINAEFGRGNDLNSYRGTTWYTDAGGSGTFSSGAISISDFYGKRATSPMWTGTITSHQNKLNLRSWAIANGYSGSGAAQITIASGVYIYSDDVNTPALTIDGSWGGLTLINNGYIMGMGGHGGGAYFNGSAYSYNYEISSGGSAINLGVSCTIQNNSYIGGGGGGGASASSTAYFGGGGAGGGIGGSLNSNGTWYYGGAGGGIGSSGSNGNSSSSTGGGGGRIMPGSNTTVSVTYQGLTVTSTGGGANNSGSSSASGTSSVQGFSVSFGLGGSGGGTGGVYAAYYYTASSIAGGGGGGWGASGGSSLVGQTLSLSGAAGGKCVNLNGYSITWSATGTRYGAIS